MRVGIMSDSHDNLPAIVKAVSVFNDGDVEMVIHAGDLVAPFVSKPLKMLKAKLVAVFGNNDGERLGLEKVLNGHIYRAPHTIDIAGKKVLILHEPDGLEALIKSDVYDVIIYGHTHQTDIRTGRTIVINPGETGGWLYGERTVAIWDVDSGEVEVIPLK